jgi:CheY-like chemotaxis protein
MAAAGLLAALWAILLRIKVQSQTKLIRTQLKNLAQMQHVAEAASKAKSEFLANMSHEIRTPMNGVLGFARMALEQASGDQRENLEMVCESAGSLIAIVDDILDFSKVEAGQMSFEAVACSLPDLVQRTFRLFSVRAAERKLAFTCSIAPDVPQYVQTDPTRLKQILMNLLSNAIKFTDEGSVSLAVTLLSRSEDQAHVRFAVRDTGSGIPMERQKAIFDAFTQADNSITRRYGGTGLGLTICSRLAGLAGGDLSVESTPGVGSSFFVNLPFAIANGCADRPQVAVTPSWEKGLRILVAEDNPVNQKLIFKLLSRRGALVTLVGNGLRAVEEFRPGRFDLILMDLQMPEMDGFAAVQAIRRMESAPEHVVVLALTADVMPETKVVCDSAGMDGFVTKPVSLHAIQQEYVRSLRKIPVSAHSAAGPHPRSSDE